MDKQLYLCLIGLNGECFPCGYTLVKCITISENQWKAIQKTVKHVEANDYYSSGQITHVECKLISKVESLEKDNISVVFIP